jgi:hypothetical protein
MAHQRKEIIMKARNTVIAAGIAAAFALGASAAFINHDGYSDLRGNGIALKADEGVPHNLITALKADEGVPHNLVTAMKADEGVPHNLVTSA